jgi:CRP-like cAMP-binding protein
MRRTRDVNGIARRNALLAALPEPDLAKMTARMENVELEIRDRLFASNRPIRDVYFPLDGVCSVVGFLSSGQPVEVATIGREGFVGLPLFLGADRTPAETFSQVRGSALRMSAGDFLAEVKRSQALRDVLHRYTQAMFTLVAQGSVCNRAHSVVERCARWLLLTHDRVGTDVFELTQDFLAQMLGVRRATVSEAAGALQRKGAIEYRRGRITIKNRKQLEALSCECYRIVTADFHRLIGTDGELPAQAKPSRRSRSARRATARNRGRSSA